MPVHELPPLKADEGPAGEEASDEASKEDSKEASEEATTDKKALQPPAEELATLLAAGLEPREGVPGLFLCRSERGYPIVPTEPIKLTGRAQEIADAMRDKLVTRLMEKGTEGLPTTNITGEEGADLKGAWLQGANLYGAQLQGAILYKAQLQGAILYEAQLQGANLNGAGAPSCDERCLGSSAGAEVRTLPADFRTALEHDSCANPESGVCTVSACGSLAAAGSRRLSARL